MLNGNERPICHRAEDLVTYLYGEATAEEARDFNTHMQNCDACRGEFNIFNQVHESIVTWRNEALGPIASPASAPAMSFVTPEVVQHGRRLPALAALREFFTVSPLWLRGATVFAGLLLCTLLVFAAARFWRQPISNGENAAKYTDKQLREEVEKQVAERIAKSNTAQVNQASTAQVANEPPQITPNAAPPARPYPHTRNRLTREERVQLAADLGLIQAREEEAPFVLPDEPNQ